MDRLFLAYRNIFACATILFMCDLHRVLCSREIEVTPELVYVEKTGSANFECKSKVARNPTILWFKKRSDLTLQIFGSEPQSQYSLSDDHRNLTVGNVYEEDTLWVYTCKYNDKDSYNQGEISIKYHQKLTLELMDFRDRQIAGFARLGSMVAVRVSVECSFPPAYIQCRFVPNGINIVPYMSKQEVYARCSALITGGKSTTFLAQFIVTKDVNGVECTATVFREQMKASQNFSIQHDGKVCNHVMITGYAIAHASVELDGIYRQRDARTFESLNSQFHICYIHDRSGSIWEVRSSACTLAVGASVILTGEDYSDNAGGNPIGIKYWKRNGQYDHKIAVFCVDDQRARLEMIKASYALCNCLNGDWNLESKAMIHPGSILTFSFLQVLEDSVGSPICTTTYSSEVNFIAAGTVKIGRVSFTHYYRNFTIQSDSSLFSVSCYQSNIANVSFDVCFDVDATASTTIAEYPLALRLIRDTDDRSTAPDIDPDYPEEQSGWFSWLGVCAGSPWRYITFVFAAINIIELILFFGWIIKGLLEVNVIRENIFREVDEDEDIPRAIKIAAKASRMSTNPQYDKFLAHAGTRYSQMSIGGSRPIGVSRSRMSYM